jgi:hypothetical protein
MSRWARHVALMSESMPSDPIFIAQILRRRQLGRHTVEDRITLIFQTETRCENQEGAGLAWY